ncbi:MAG: TonB-dependent receptor [Fluviicola sp.]|nr:TonB-dependent receptor [Fluviicola sp.]
MKTRITKMLWMFALTTSFGATAQHSIQGTITSSDGKPLPGAKVVIENTYNGAFTDGQGHYLLKDVKDDSLKLSVSMLGFEVQSFNLYLKDQDLTQNVILSPSALMIEEVQVSGVRADEKTPTTYTNLNTKEIQKGNFGQDLPYILQSTPSTVVTSDAGAGVGYTGIRIRGVDPTRTNVTVNGIPMNDAESHGVYWVNMPDFASSVDNIQVQRGVGTSTNGAASFGSSINIKTDNIQKQAYAELDNSGGSFNTLRNTVKVGSGLINNKFVVDARLSRVSSDGYIDRATSDLKSYYLSGAWIGKKSIVKANVFSGKEVTYQAWYGIPEAKLFGNKDSLLNHFYNNYYPGGTYQTVEDSVNLFNSDPRKYNYYNYKNETDNYKQDHYQLHFSHTFNPKVSMNLAGHFTNGEGYYEQYRRDQKFSTYGLDTLFVGTDTISKTDLIRRRWLDNNFYGAIFSVTYSNLKNLKVIAGGAANQYDGKHFGEIIWARNASSSEINQHYYDNMAHKKEVSGYVKANYQIQKLNVFADLQVRHIAYDYHGADQYYANLVPLKENVAFTFFNPKAGLMYDFNNKNNMYASFSMANREPVRDDFVQSSVYSRPKPEQLQNVEVGYRYHARKLFTNVNYYLMNYKDQLILTGQINDVGAYNRANVAKSYRTGIELEAGYMLLKKLSVTGNVTLSMNKIKEFNEYVDNYDNYDVDGNMIQTVITHKNTDIAFSPATIASLGLIYEPIKNLDITLQSKYVGNQYLDNTSNESKKLNAYYTSNLTVNYTIKTWGFREIKIGVLANNLFNYLYENNGYTWGYIAGGKRITENYYYPQAGRNFLVRLTLKM